MAVQLKGSSLMEVIISSVIMLIVFILSMEIITKLSSRKDDNREEMMALQTMKLLINTDLQEQIISYQWGEIEVIKEELSTKLEKIIIISTVKEKTWQLTKVSEKHPPCPN